MVFQEAVRKVQVVEVQQTRKRSSRLAVINQDKEAIAAARAKQLEIEETNQRETRRIKREEEKIKRELQRELRAKEREERFLDGDKKVTFNSCIPVFLLSPNALIVRLFSGALSFIRKPGRFKRWYFG